MIFCSQCTQDKWWQQQERGLNRQRAFLTGFYTIAYTVVGSTCIYWIQGRYLALLYKYFKARFRGRVTCIVQICKDSPCMLLGIPPQKEGKKNHQLNSLNQRHAFMHFENPALAYNPVYVTGPVTFWREVQLGTQNLLGLELIQGASDSTG